MSHGRWCLVCQRQRPNEAFNRAGCRSGICRECQRMPATEFERIKALDELDRYLLQSNISERNLARVTELSFHDDPTLREYAGAIHVIAKIHPRRRRRWKYLMEHHPDALRRCLDVMGSDMLDMISEHMDESTWLDLHDFGADDQIPF